MTSTLKSKKCKHASIMAGEKGEHIPLFAHSFELIRPKNRPHSLTGQYLMLY